MQKIKFMDIYYVFNFLVLILLSLFITSINDELLFKSDLLSLIHYILGLNLFLVLILTPLFVPIIFLKDEIKEKISSLLIYFLLINLILGFLYKALLRQVFTFSSVTYLLIAAALLYLFCIIITFILPDKKEIKERIIRFSKWFMSISFIFVILLTAFRHIEHRFSVPGDNKKNVVMIIMDGLSTHELPCYNPEVKMPEFDDIVKDATLYKNIYTNFTYTSGFFDALYGGTKDNSVFSKNRKPRPVNLIKILQDDGINFRWAVNHSNGIPDVSLVNSYNGIRSFYLNENLTWLPYILGLNYNIYRTGGINKNDPKIRKLITSYLIKLPKQSNPLETHLVKEIERLRNTGKPFFFVYHTAYNGEAAVESSNEKETRLWEKLDLKLNSNIIQNEIRKNDYVYQKKDARLVDILSKQYFKNIGSGIETVKRFLKIFKEQRWNEDTIIIITADHGEIFSKGKAWYGFHNEEEVTRVPLLIFDNQRRGIDSRLGETIDISQTILDYFGIKEKISANAVSLLGEEKKKYVTTLTTFSSLRNEQFLNVYELKGAEINKYYFNVKKNYDIILESRVKGFDTVNIQEINNNSEKLDFQYLKILAEYGL